MSGFELNTSSLKISIVQEPSADDQITVPAHNRTKAGRKPLDPDIPEDKKICGCGHNLDKIDEVVSERLRG